MAAPYSGQQVSLRAQASRYVDLGYSVGMAKGKEFLGALDPWDNSLPAECDGISIIPDGLVCIDYDCEFKDLGWRRDVPPTLKEKTPRGWHLFYLLPVGYSKEHWEPHIEWQPDVDLLVNDGRSRPYKSTTLNWARHILMSPTPGYRRIYPDQIPERNKLTIAPDWLVQEVTSKKGSRKKAAVTVGSTLDDFL
jgi:hypothetical protein